MRKRSRQRESILAYLRSRTDHPAAETVYQEIRKEMPNISLATVYRNLSLLTEIGEIRKVPVSQGPDRFDANTYPHDHFLCERCGRIMDLEMRRIEEVAKADGTPFDGRIDRQRTNYYGLCPECLAETESEIA